MTSHCQNFIFRIITSISLYFCMASSIVRIFVKGHYTLYDNYFLLTIWCSTIALIVTQLHISKTQSQPIWPSLKTHILPILLITFSFFTVRWNYFFSPNIWLDEYTQFIISHFPEKNLSSIALFAAQQQQPPLDYYLSAFSRLLFGETIFAVKLHVVIFSLLFFQLLYLICFDLFKSKAAGILAVGLLIANPFFTHYSFEARPYFLALLFALSTLYTWLTDYQLSSAKKWVFSIVIPFLFLSTISLQPILLISLFTLITLTLTVLNKTKHNLYVSLFGSAISTLLFAPAIYFTISSSIPLNKFNTDSYLEMFSVALSKTGFSNYINVYGPIRLVTILTIIFSVIYLAARFFHQRRKLGNSLPTKHLIVLASLAVLFPPFCISIFSAFINWQPSPRYFLVSNIPVILLASFLFAELTSIIPDQKNYFRKLFLIIILVFTIPLSHSSFLAVDTGLSWAQNRVEWGTGYKLLQKRLRGDDLVFQLSFHQPGGWRANLFVGLEHYLPSNLWQHFTTPNSSIDHVHSTKNFGLQLSEKSKSKDKIYFLINESQNADMFENTFEKILYRSHPPILIYRFNQITILEFPHPANSRVIKWITRITEQFPQNSELSQLYEILIFQAIGSKNWSDANRLLNLLIESLKHPNLGPTKNGNSTDISELIRQKNDYFRALINSHQ